MIPSLIRPAEFRDLSQLYLLLRAKAEFDGALSAMTASQQELGRAIFCEKPGCEFAVAELDRKLLGFVSFYPVFSTYAARPGLWMDDLFVDAEVRSRGIGLSLLKYVASVAVARDCCKLEWSLQVSNFRGTAFYQREGAVIREQNRFAKLDRQVVCGRRTTTLWSAAVNDEVHICGVGVQRALLRRQSVGLTDDS
jgi:GNAT superfamily N-acetyltransferase